MSKFLPDNLETFTKGIFEMAERDFKKTFPDKEPFNPEQLINEVCDAN